MPLALDLTAALALLATAQEPPGAGRAAAMAEMARGVAMTSDHDGSAIPVIAEPIYRFDDPARRFSDGTVWAFGSPGRPAALLTFSLERTPAGAFQWLYEFTKLADGPIRADIAGVGPRTWVPDKPGLALTPIPGASAPAADEARRLRQLNELARRFKAHEFFKPAPNAREERYELRMLSRPVLRYADPDSGPIDGAAFLITYGQNPELVLTIEARRDGGSARWMYGVARISAARAHILLDGREVATFPEWPENSPRTPYYVYVAPAPGVEDEAP